MKNAIGETITFDAIKSQLNASLYLELGTKFSSVNSGGCGVVAYNLAKKLCEVGFDAKIAWLDTTNRTKEEIETFNSLLTNNSSIDLREINANGIRCAHCMVLVDGHFIDANGVTKELSGKWSIFPHTTTITWEQLKPLAENKMGWNEMFDRKDIPAIETTIKKIVNNLN